MTVELICKPTPLHRLNHASQALGIDLWIKRDDLTGFAGGGNKGRKLEFLIADALAQNSDCFVTCGAYQSNFVRQAAYAAQMFNMQFHAAVMHWPHPGAGRETRPANWQPEREPSGNIKLTLFSGASITVAEDGTFDELENHATAIANKLRESGKNVYQTPAGGSSPVGALGFVAAVDELLSQTTPFDQIVFASGSGSTQVGLAFGHARANVGTNIIGICTDDEPEMVDYFAEIAEGVSQLTLSDTKLSPSDFVLDTSFHGGGYQSHSDGAREAIRFLAEAEGIFLDPVYTGKAFAGLMDYAKRGKLPGRTLFWHTGGFPTLFANDQTL